MNDGEKHTLAQLARLYGVAVAYRDFTGRRRQASPPALLAVLQALGAPVSGAADLPEALCRRKLELWRCPSDPVAVCRAGEQPTLELRLEAGKSNVPISCRLEPEAGEPLQWTCMPDRLPVIRTEKFAGVEYTARRMTVPAKLPLGYHRLSLDFAAASRTVSLISAPARAYSPAAGSRLWGIFAPLYALHSATSWAAGSVTDLEALSSWVGSLGGKIVGTLPLLACFLEEPFEPSPYSPVSRLFWNEFYLDVALIPELENCPKARELLNSRAFEVEIAALRRAPLVDYRRGMAVKRKVLELLMRCCYMGQPARLEELRRWAAQNQAAVDYACFRAAVSRQGPVWAHWPERMRKGDLQPGDYDLETKRYHLYVQWVARQQFGNLASRTKADSRGLYLDFPLGVHRDGYDVWRWQELFAVGAACGAPPDQLNAAGQNWEFPPLHPDKLREQGYRYYIASLRHHLRHAGVLRLDHVAGLHRLFWIPAGLPAAEGVYIHYRHEEFYAILALESCRHRTALVGEDLGTVPSSVRAALSRHGLKGMYVLPFEGKSQPRKGWRPVPAGSLACLNTHDMPPFAAFWHDSKPAARAGLARFLRRKGFLKTRSPGARAMLRACYSYLAAGRAGMVLINLEDLWLETASQNMPGTGREQPNWRRKASYSLEDLRRLPGILEILKKIDQFRHRTKQ
ncbi:MAG: 4-alpha-glucanotransferase [Firmicutes bacterium]|nr:4-alpha-glucanotransferase [Bacillota bacterium]